jgi:uncharacterized phage protein (TIGR02218 family)
MSKTISAPMQTHLDGEVTSLSTCWAVRRINDVTLLYTDHDEDIDLTSEGIFTGRHSFLNGNYSSTEGTTRTAISSDEGAIDNLEIEAILTDDGINADDIQAGQYDGAQVFVFKINWDDLSDGIIRMPGSGTLGEFTTEPRKGTYTVELRGLNQFLTHRMGELYSPGCRTDLFSAKCKLDESTQVNYGVVQSVESKRQFGVEITPTSFTDQDLTIVNFSFEAGWQDGDAITGWTEGTVQSAGQWSTAGYAPNAIMVEDTPVEFRDTDPASIVRKAGLFVGACEFTNTNPDTLVRGSGSWLDDGFVMDQMIEVDQSVSNDGFWHVSPVVPVTDLVMTLDITEDLTTEPAGGFIVVYSVVPTGSWVNDNFERAMLINISGSPSNNGTYLVGEHYFAVTGLVLEMHPDVSFVAQDSIINVSIAALSPSIGEFILEGDKQPTHDQQRDFEIYSDSIAISTGGGGEPTTTDIDDGLCIIELTAALLSLAAVDDTAKIGVIFEDGSNVEIDRVLCPTIRRDQHGLNGSYYMDMIRTFAIPPLTRNVRIRLTQRKNLTPGTCGIRFDNIRATVKPMPIISLGEDRDTTVLRDWFDGGIVKFLTGANQDRAQEIDVYYQQQADMVLLTPVTLFNSDPDTLTRTTGSWIDDGFEDGMTLTITGSASDDGDYLIDTVTAGTITLDAGESLVGEAEQTDLTVVAGLIRTVFTFLPLPFLPAVGDQFMMYPGCKKRWTEDCAQKFDNALNFRGEPFVPGRDEAFKTADVR